jgi:cysteine desulfurase NifS
VVAIDPRRNGSAREVDAEWVPIRPGTDGALALSMIEVLIEEELYDEPFVERWTVGFQDLARLTQHYRPDAVEKITGVPAETIRSLARRIAKARGACPIMYSGLEYSDTGVQAIRAVHTLWALAGQLDVPGGLLFRMKDQQFPQNRRRLVANPNPAGALGRDRFPVYSQYRGESHAIALPDSVLRGEPYKIHSLIILGGSIITSWPQPEIWKETLGALDFLVCIDRYPTADAAYADIVLPATTGYEITSFMRYGPLFKIRERLIEPQGEARNDFLILAELAARLGYGDLYPQSEEDVLVWALEGTGYTVEEVRAAGGSVQLPTTMMQYKKWEKGGLRSDGKDGFDTPSGKFEIASSVLAEHGYQPLPDYTEPAEGPLARPDLARRYPLVFNSGTRTRWDFRSQHHGVKSLARHYDGPQVVINTADAAERGIASGDMVRVETPRSALEFRAYVTDDIVRGTVDASMGGGGPLGSKAWQRNNVNELTNLQHYDPISGFPVYKTLLCQVSRVAAGGGSGPAADEGAEHSPDELSKAIPKVARRVYLDHNATTPVDPEVVDAMLPFLRDDWGNPSSIYDVGNRARESQEAARRKVAQVLGCTARRLTFTSGGSEANNLALKGVMRGLDGKGHVISTTVEHPAILATCRALEAEGHTVTLLPVDGDGRADPEDLRAALRPDTALVSVMSANNEIGALQPVADLARITREHGALFHTDAVQALGKIPLDVDELGVDLLSVSSHKIHGPKGVGALYVRKGIELVPLIHGGGQERGLRSGTENVPGMIGFGKACELAQRRLLAGEMDRVASLRDKLEKGVLALVDGARRNGPAERRLPNTSNLTLPGIRGESLVLSLNRYGVWFSSGSACKSGNPAPSHALLAMGLSEDDAHCAVRFSLGTGNNEEDIDYALERLGEVLRDTAGAIRFIGCR